MVNFFGFFALIVLISTCHIAAKGLPARRVSSDLTLQIRAHAAASYLVSRLAKLPNQFSALEISRHGLRDPQKILNMGGGSVEAGTEGYDPISATAEPSSDCRKMAQQYRGECLFGHSFSNDPPRRL